MSPRGCIDGSLKQQRANLVWRIRKIKCDEDRPACRRCVSTGRVCDGYGVWGHGANFHGNRQRPPVSKDSDVVAPLLRTSVSLFTGLSDEHEYLEWFKCRTSKKIPGASILALWDTLLYPASLSEPALLHAVLSLSSLHKREIYDSNYGRRRTNTLDKQEQFTLQHYIKAIRHLQPHFSTQDKASVRVALMTCFVFVCLELLCGHFATAQTHLKNGLMILRELGMPFKEDDGVLLFETVPNSIDDSIVKAFCRLDLQLELFRHSYLHPCLALQISGPESSTPVFRSVNEAWRQIERLFSKIFHLTERWRRQQQVSHHLFVEHPSPLLAYQQQIRLELSMCLNALEASTNSMQDQDSKGLAYRLLFVYHTMAGIMANACLRQDDESIFDSHTQRFVFILNQSVVMWQTNQSGLPHRPLPWPRIHMSRSIVDIGWIAPLYYTALKCRVHRVRLQAIRLIETTSYREGIWDSKISSCVARKVMETEEGGFYKDFDAADNFLLSSSPRWQDLSLPTLPQADRIHEVRVSLSDGPNDTIPLLYRQAQRDWEVIQVSTRGDGIAT